MALAARFIEKSMFHSIGNFVFSCWRLYDGVPSKHWSSSMDFSLFRICSTREAEGNSNLNMNSFWRWWESMSTPQLMALGWQMNASVRETVTLETGKNIHGCFAATDESVEFSVSPTLTSTFSPLSSWRVASSSASFPDIISVSSSINHITTLIAMQIPSLSSLQRWQTSRLHSQFCIINYSARRREGFHGCRRQSFAISLYRPLLDTIAAARLLVISVI